MNLMGKWGMRKVPHRDVSGIRRCIREAVKILRDIIDIVRQVEKGKIYFIFNHR